MGETTYELMPAVERPPALPLRPTYEIYDCDPSTITAYPYTKVRGGKPVREWDYIARAKLLLQAYEEGGEWLHEKDFNELQKLVREEKERQDRELDMSSGLLCKVTFDDEWELLTLLLSDPRLTHEQRERVQEERTRRYPSILEKQYRTLKRWTETLESDRHIIPLLRRMEY